MQELVTHCNWSYYRYLKVYTYHPHEKKTPCFPGGSSALCRAAGLTLCFYASQRAEESASNEKGLEDFGLISLDQKNNLL